MERAVAHDIETSMQKAALEVGGSLLDQLEERDIVVAAKGKGNVERKLEGRLQPDRGREPKAHVDDLVERRCLEHAQDVVAPELGLVGTWLADVGVHL